MTLDDPKRDFLYTLVVPYIVFWPPEGKWYAVEPIFPAVSSCQEIFSAHPIASIFAEKTSLIHPTALGV